MAASVDSRADKLSRSDPTPSRAIDVLGTGTSGGFGWVSPGFCSEAAVTVLRCSGSCGPPTVISVGPGAAACAVTHLPLGGQFSRRTRSLLRGLLPPCRRAPCKSPMRGILPGTAAALRGRSSLSLYGATGKSAVFVLSFVKSSCGTMAGEGAWTNRVSTYGAPGSGRLEAGPRRADAVLARRSSRLAPYGVIHETK